MKLQRKAFFFVIIVLLFFMKTDCYATEQEENQSVHTSDYVDEYYDIYFNQDSFQNVDDTLSQIQQKYNYSSVISFEEVTKLLMEGNIDEAMGMVFEKLYMGIFDEIMLNKNLLLRLLLLIIIAAVFRNYSSILKTSYVGEQGFYITYLLMVVILLQSFLTIYSISEDTINCIKELMQCMLPALFLTLALCGGITTSQVMNSMFLTMLTFWESVLLNVILPGIQIYFLIVILNPINREDRFSKIASLLKQGIEFILKSIVTIVIGLNVVKGMLVPIYENTKYNMLRKGLSVIPGGAALTGLSSILLGAGVLIKNSVGIAVVIVLLVLSGIPLLKIFVIYALYKVMIAMVQPISDNRVLLGIQGICDSIGILLRATYTSVVLSVLSIAILILTTNYL
ncbi:MAG: stage III sporulation protein AE [Lachnospiraceae bacterium]